MVFGKKNKNEVQYYVDQIERLKEENASLNACINNLNTELKHYKAFFNNNSKLLEASNRMNIACGDIKDAFDHLIDHSEAIHFPSQNVNVTSGTENLYGESSNDVINNNAVSNTKQNMTSEVVPTSDTFSELFDENDDVSFKSQELNTETHDLSQTVSSLNDFSADENNNDFNNTNSAIAMKDSQEQTQFKIENTTEKVNSDDMISGEYATKSEMIAGHVDSLFAMDEHDHDQINHTAVSYQSDDFSSANQPITTEKNDVVSDVDNLFDESEIIEENNNNPLSTVATSKNDYNLPGDTTVLTETEMIDIKSASSANSANGNISHDSFDSVYHSEADFVGKNIVLGESASYISKNVDELFDEELIDSNKIKPISQRNKKDMSDIFLQDEPLSDSQSETSSNDVKAANEFEDESQEYINNYNYELTPKGQHIAFDESNFGSLSSKEGFKGDMTKETDDIFEIEEVSEKSNVSDSDIDDTKAEHSYQINDDDKSETVSEARNRITSIDLHEEIAWIKPKRNPRKRNFSYLIQD